MKPMFKSKTLWIGIILGVIISFVVNFIDYKRKYDALCMDCDNDFGLPFIIFQSGSSMHATKMLWVGIFANILVLGLCSFGLGLLNYLFWSKVKASQLK